MSISKDFVALAAAMAMQRNAAGYYKVEISHLCPPSDSLFLLLCLVTVVTRTSVLELSI